MAGSRSATYDSNAMAATATLASKAVTVTPGGEAVTEVRIRNSGTVVDQFTLEVLGDASAWTIVEPAVIPLFPGAEAVARVRFKPPKSSSVPARAVPFAVRVKSREDTRASLVEEGVVEVGPFNDTFAELIPRTAKGSSRAHARLALDNRGNVRISARLTAADPDRKLNFTITPPALSSEPGTASFASVRMSPKQRFLTGPLKTNPYKVIVHQDNLPPITVDGTMQQEGLIPPWLLPALIGLAALALVLVLLWFLVIKHTIQSAATEAVAPQTSSLQAQVNTLKANQPPPAPGGGGGATGDDRHIERHSRPRGRSRPPQPEEGDREQGENDRRGQPVRTRADDDRLPMFTARGRCIGEERDPGGVERGQQRRCRQCARHTERPRRAPEQRRNLLGRRARDRKCAFAVDDEHVAGHP